MTPILVLLCAATAHAQADSTRRDSTQAARARRDSLARRDSVARRDSLKTLQDSSTARDSLKTPQDSSTARDSLRLSRDSSAARDSAVVRDSMTIRDTAVVSDSMKIRDSVSVRDSVVARDTAVVRDSLASRDSALARDSTAADSTRAVRDSATARTDTSSARDTLLLRESAPVPKPVRVPPVNVRLASGRTLKDSLELAATIRAGLSNTGWPVRTPPLLPGSILPTKRVVAFYGTPLSRRMGVLGQYPQEQMLAKLDSVCAQWRAADPATPVQPALHFIAVVAQAAPGKDGKYRLRMDSALIEKVYGWAHAHGALLFLDIQAGHSTIVDELPRLAKFLERPDVHLGVDPEFNMRYLPDSVAPGKQIGSVRAAEINQTIAFLARIVDDKKLPPKILVVHRFRTPMVRNARDIKLDSRVQIVMHMDGWGVPSIKYGSYREYIVNEPVQFTGFKLFYKQDTSLGDKLLTPAEILQLYPRPLYIQYQ